MKILVVDDLEINLKLLRLQLEAEGFEVVTAVDGVDALSVLQKQPIDALVTDVFMPNMDGYRLSSQVRNNEKFRKIPIIIYSSTHVSPGDKQLAIESGADAFFEKTGKPTIMANLIRKLVQNIDRDVKVTKPIGEITILKQYSEMLVRKLEEKNAELMEKINELQRVVASMIGRENKMIELKKQVNDLSGQLGKAPPYDLSFLEKKD